MRSKKLLIAEIISAMTKNDISQTKLADKLGYHQSDISCILSGAKTASLEKLINIARGAKVKDKIITRLICWKA